VLFGILLLSVYLFFPGKAMQFVLALLLATGILSFLWSLALRRGLSAERTVRDLRVARFDSLELVVILENRSRLPAPACYLADTPGLLSNAADDGRWIVTLAPRERTVLRYTVAASERGEYGVGPLRIASGDPLGLFPFTKEIGDWSTVLVRPARVDLDLAFDSGLPQGSITIRNPLYEDVTLYRSVRDYRGGDELKRINWKSSARFGKLFTNEYQDSLSCPVFVFLDLEAEHYPLHLRHSIGERAIALAAGLVLRADRQRQRCGFASTGTVPETADATGPAVGDARETVHPFVAAGDSLSEGILDILARIALSAEVRDPGDLLARSLADLASGSRFFYVSPAAPDGIAGQGRIFRPHSEYIHELVR
jgi:Uncharacterized conserved protein (some members contain a von Willebrand factor type A (vWA) domain)